jgi:hypothetical protein
MFLGFLDHFIGDMESFYPDDAKRILQVCALLIIGSLVFIFAS